MVEIENQYHLSNLIGIRWEIFKEILNNSDKEYQVFTITQKNKKKREIYAPSDELRLCQKFIKEYILEKIPTSQFCTGFKQEQSIKTNAERHLGCNYLLNMDIQNFFSSIKEKRVFGCLKKNTEYSNEVLMCLTELCCYNGFLPQGACTSPDLSNIIAYDLDIRLSKMSDRFHFVYSRYADDLTFSSKEYISKNAYHDIIQLIQNEGFKVNYKKTRFASKDQRMEVTGLLINTGTVKISRTYKKELEQELYYVKKFGLQNHRERKGFKNLYYQDHVLGKILFVYSIEPDASKKIFQMYSEIDWDSM